MPNRHASSDSYRYGFQGQEKDDEVKGEGNSLNYTFRMHDPRVGRFFARDPLESKYPELSPYQFSSNTPIRAVELEGLESALEHSLDKKFASSAYMHMTTAQRNEERKVQAVAAVLTLTALIDIYITKGWLTRTVAGAGLLESMNETERGHEAAAKGNYGEAHRRYLNAGEANKLAVFEVGGIVAIQGLGKLNQITKLKIFGIPQGLSYSKFLSASNKLRNAVSGISDDIVVQGSRASGKAKAASDIDFAIKVDADKFDELIESSFGKPNPGSAKEKTMLHAIKTGKIQAGEAGLSGLRKELAGELGMDVDLSIVKKGGEFDNGAQLPIKK